MAMKLKRGDAEKNKLFSVIDAHSKETKSKAAPDDIKTFLLYIPKDLHKKLKNEATNKEINLHDHIIEVLSNRG